jgi:hypothetical protein
MKTAVTILWMGMVTMLTGCAFQPASLPPNHPANPTAPESRVPPAMPMLTSPAQTNAMPAQNNEMPEHQHHGKDTQ